jgi:hypothetical protein
MEFPNGHSRVNHRLALGQRRFVFGSRASGANMRAA